jgi:hypothetical protein
VDLGFVVLLTGLWASQAPQAAGRPLLAEETWYREAPEPEREFEGKVDYQVGDGRIGLPQRYAGFRILGVEEGRPVARPLYTADRDYLLAPLVGRRVKLLGKVVSREVQGRQIGEFWPGRLLADLGEAGEAVGEIRVLARTSRWIPARRTAQPQAFVIRDAATLAQLSGMAGQGAEAAAERSLCQMLEAKPGTAGITGIDWKRQMLLAISGGIQPTGGAKVEVTRLVLQEKGMEVFWKLVTQPGGVGLPPTETLLLPRFEGEIRILREGTQEPIVLPAVGSPPSGPARR